MTKETYSVTEEKIIETSHYFIRKMAIMKHDITEKTREVRDHKNWDKTEEAEERKRARVKLNNRTQIKILDDRLGVGAAKERKRLMQ